MKRVTLISLHTPTIENLRGASALPFHLIKARPDDIEVNILTYNLNEVSAADIQKISIQLNTQIKVIDHNIKVKLLRNRVFSWCRALLNTPVLSKLTLKTNTIQYILDTSDYVWIYGEDIGHLTSFFNQKIPCVITTPDCEALYYSRILFMPSKLQNLISVLRYSKAYSQYLNLARNLPVKNTIFHLVGEKDAQFLSQIQPDAKTCFIPHPHYDGNTSRPIKFHSPKIRLLISGRYDFYCKEGYDNFIDVFEENPDLIKHYEITFQGKGWDKFVEKLKKVGYDVNSIGYVPVYKDELCRHDILVSAITLGTGTKGKILDAFINGLLVIGTERSIENILVEDQKDYFFFNSKQSLNDILHFIPQNIDKCEQIAVCGRANVLKNHNINSIAAVFYSLFN